MTSDLQISKAAKPSLKDPLRAAASSSRASPPQPGPRPRGPSAAPLTPGRPAPSGSSPQRARRAIGAGGRRAPGRAAAASGGASASGAGAGGWGVGEPGGGRDGTRRAPRLSRREEETTTSPKPKKARMGRRKKGTPSLYRTPISGPPRFPHPHLPLRGMAACKLRLAFPSTPASTPRNPALPGLLGSDLL